MSQPKGYNFNPPAPAAAWPVAWTLALTLTGCNLPSTPAPEETWRSTPVADFGRRPRWSPDGTALAFGGDHPDSTGIWIWDPEQGVRSAADSLPPHNWDYRWSPDGTRLAFSAPGEPGTSGSGLWVVDLDSRTARQVRSEGRHPSWISDSALIFQTYSNPPNQPAVVELNLASGAVHTVGSGFHPLAAPTGWVAWSDAESGGRLHLRPPSGAPVTVGDSGAVQWEWSANGKVLAAVFADYARGVTEGTLWRVTVAPSGTVSGQAVALWAGFPAPDGSGSQIAFLRMSAARIVGVWIWSGTETRIADYAENPDFNPRSERLAANLAGGGVVVLSP